MSTAPIVYRFGPFVLDTAERQLLREGIVVPLSKRPMAVLLVLVGQAGHLVTKEQLLAEAWGDCVVEDNALSVAISRLRQALGSTGTSALYIETVAGYGYRFVEPVTVIDRYAKRRTTESYGHSLPATRRRIGLPTLASIGLLGLTLLTIIPFVHRSLSMNHLSMEVASPPPARLHIDHANNSRMIAQDAYRRGREALDSRRSGSDALDAFSLARAVDPTFAPAYLGMADVYAMGHRTHVEAIALIEEALALDPDLGEAYATLGFIHGFQRWDWDRAERAFEQALKSAPDYARTYQWHAAALLVQRRFDDAEAALRHALSIEPHSPNLHADLCEVLMARRDFPSARRSCHHALDYDADFPFARGHLFWMDLMSGDLDAARARLPITDPNLRDRLEATDGSSESFFDTIVIHLEQTHSSRPFEAYFLARLQSIRGEEAKAMDALREALRMRAFHAPFVNADPAFDSIRNAEPFGDLIAEMGLR